MQASHDHVEGLRPRSCKEPSCGAIFTVCASCDRGQRYCSEPCRSRQRRNQVLTAGKRYQASETGKRAHCRRQQAYRGRRCEASVTHQAMAPITPPATPILRSLTHCVICGRSNHWINPYYSLIPRRRRRRRSAKVQISTFSRDR
jgi:hypothetical protein